MRAAVAVGRRRRFVGCSALLALLLLLLFPVLWRELAALLLASQLQEGRPGDGAHDAYDTQGTGLNDDPYHYAYADPDRFRPLQPPLPPRAIKQNLNQNAPAVPSGIQLVAHRNSKQSASGVSDRAHVKTADNSAPAFPSPSPECAAHTFLSVQELLSAIPIGAQNTSSISSLSAPPPLSPALGAERPDGLVRVIHQSWKTRELPPRFAAWADTWCACLPGWRRVLWTDVDNERLVREHYAWFYARWKAFRKPINRVDALRYMYLHRFGGLYTDLDNICIRPLEHLLRCSCGRAFDVVLGDMEAERWPGRPWNFLQNSLMYSRAGHPFWLHLLRSLTEEGTQRREGVIGSVQLMRVLDAGWHTHSYSKDVHIHPPRVLNPFSYRVPNLSPCRQFNQMNDEQLARCLAFHRAHNETHVVQVHTQTWWQGRVL